jgi:outer membrane protein assembly factor BamB
MKAFGLIALVVLTTAACASRAVREPPAPLAEFPAAYDVNQSWSTDVGASSAKGYLRLSPRAAEGFVYAADPDGRVAEFAVESGKRIWDVDLHTPIGGAVGVGDNLVSVGTRRGQVIALARDTGKEVWRASVSSEVLAPPAIGGGVVAVQTVDGRLTGFAAADGKRLWVYERSEPALSLRGTDAPVIAADAVIAGFASGKLVALRSQDGGVLWEATVSQPRGRNEIERLVDVDVVPIVTSDAIYAASYQGKLVALNPSSGAVLWSRDVSTYTGLATDGTNIYVTDDKSHVLAFNRHDGTTRWKQEAFHGRSLNGPVVYGDFVVVADYEGYVHWLARDDGRVLARYNIGHGAVRAPATFDGETLLVADVSGTLSALRVKPK